LEPQNRLEIVQELVKPENVNLVTLDAIGKVAEREDMRENLLLIAIQQLQNKQALHTTIPIINEIMKIYKWKTNKDRVQFINKMKDNILPILAEIANQILQQFESHRNNAQTAFILKKIVRVYYDLLVCELPNFLREDAQLALWGQICLGIISLHIRPLENGQHEHWVKTKKWAYRSINKLFSR
jgi:hypothetical protein